MLVLLDRDGVINEDRADSVTSPDQMVLIEGSASAIAVLNRAGIKVAVITNQSVVGRAIITQAQLDSIHTHMQQLLAKHGAHVDAIYSCTDHPDRPTPRRKPGAAMLYEALQHFAADAAHTPMVGDALRDLQAAYAAGCPRYLVRTGKGAALEAQGLPSDIAPVTIVDNLTAVVASVMAAKAAGL